MFEVSWGGVFWGVWDFFLGGGYLGGGIGGEKVEFLEGGGVEGKEEKRFREGSDATITMEVLEKDIEVGIIVLVDILVFQLVE